MQFLSIPQFPDSASLSLDHRALLDELYRLLVFPTSHRLFSNLFITDTDNTTTVSFLDEVLVIDRGLYPNKDTVMILGEKLDKENEVVLSQHGIARIELSPFIGTESVVDLDNSDYVYDACALKLHEGSEYASLRRKLNRVPSEFVVRGIKLEDHHKIEKLFDEWETVRPKRKDEVEHYAFEKLLTFADQLPIQFYGVYEGESLRAFSAVEITPQNELMIHFIKSDTNIVGLSEYMFVHLCDHVDDKVSIINFQQDLGIEGLRQYKTSLRPREIRAVYTSPIYSHPKTE